MKLLHLMLCVFIYIYARHWSHFQWWTLFGLEDIKPTVLINNHVTWMIFFFKEMYKVLSNIVCLKLLDKANCKFRMWKKNNQVTFATLGFHCICVLFRMHKHSVVTSLISNVWHYRKILSNVCLLIYIIYFSLSLRDCIFLLKLSMVLQTSCSNTSPMTALP